MPEIDNRDERKPEGMLAAAEKMLDTARREYRRAARHHAWSALWLALAAGMWLYMAWRGWQR